MWWYIFLFIIVEEEDFLKNDDVVGQFIFVLLIREVNSILMYCDLNLEFERKINFDLMFYFLKLFL